MTKTYLTCGLLILALCTNLNGQEKDEITRNLCRQIFGVLPDSTEINISLSSKSRSLIFIFSLPNQELKPSSTSAASILDRYHGPPSIEVEILPKYKPDELKQLKLLNDEFQRASKGPKSGGMTRFRIPNFRTQAYGFYVRLPSRVAVNKKSRRLLAEQITLLFSRAEILDIGGLISRDKFFRMLTDFDEFSTILDYEKTKGSQTKQKGQTKQRSRGP